MTTARRVHERLKRDGRGVGRGRDISGVERAVELRLEDEDDTSQRENEERTASEHTGEQMQAQ
jgi:hypothetical protein